MGLRLASLALLVCSLSAVYGHDGADDLFLHQKYKSGFVPVGQTFGKMFYWMFYSREGVDTKPLIMWLTGGPGCSSEMATLSENGPFWVQNDGTLKLNDASWTELGSVVYVDQPLGTGFSTAKDPRNYVLSEKKIAQHMSEFFEGFLQDNPEYMDRPFYLTGESYAGHYIPSIAHHLIKHPVKGLNLKGMAIGNGWVDPYVQYPAYADYAYENDLISESAYERTKKGFEVCDKTIKAGAWPLAIIQCNAVTSGILGRLNPYDIRLKCEVPPLCYNETSLTNFLNRADVKKAIGVSGKWESCDQLVHTLLLGDWVVDVRGKLSAILAAGIEVLVYHGDKDFICNWMGGLDWVNIVEWKGKEKFASQKLTPWSSTGIASARSEDRADERSSDGSKGDGEIKRLDNFTFLRVFNAGHMVPMDQPKVALAMLSSFIEGTLGVDAEDDFLTPHVSHYDNFDDAENSEFLQPLRSKRLNNREAVGIDVDVMIE